MIDGTYYARVIGATPGSPGPASQIRYAVVLSRAGGGSAYELPQVQSAVAGYGDEVLCMPAPVGSVHMAVIAGGRLTVWIPPVPVTVDCEDTP